MTQLVLPYFAIEKPSTIALVTEISLSLLGGWLLYTCIEAPFLKLRDKSTQVKMTDLMFKSKLNQLGSDVSA